MTTLEWQNTRKTLAQRKRWVIKIGSALLTNDGRGLNLDGMISWVNQIAALMEQGHEVVIVSSGSVAEGMVRLGWKTRPDSVHQLRSEERRVGKEGRVR